MKTLQYHISKLQDELPLVMKDGHIKIIKNNILKTNKNLGKDELDLIDSAFEYIRENSIAKNNDKIGFILIDWIKQLNK